MPVCEGECGGRCLKIKGAQIELVAHLTNEFADEWLAYGVAQGQSHGAMPLHRTRQTIELLGVGVAPHFPFKRLAFLGKRLAQRVPAALGVRHNLTYA